MLRFVQWPAALLLALLLPIGIFILVRMGIRSRANRLARLGTAEMTARLAPSLTAGRGRGRIFRLALAALLIGVAYAGPRWGVEQATVKGSGVDIVLALDASLSMEAPDEKPSRLVAMKEAVDQLRNLSPSDRFGLIAFAGRSYILTPMTVDNSALDLFLQNLDPTIVGQGGSSLSSALRQATALLSLDSTQSDRAIVLMSDGEGFDDSTDVLTEAKRAADAGITVITVGFGTTAGSTIPIRENGVASLKKDENGAIVVTHYSPNLLSQIAQVGKGAFIPATGLPADRGTAVRQVINRLHATPRSVPSGENLGTQFQWFVLPALLLLFADTFSVTRRVRRRAAAAATTAAMLMIGIGCHQGPSRDAAAIALYNAGTDLLNRDSLAAAIDPLTRGAETKDADALYRSRFNLGLDYLVTGIRAEKDSAKKDSTRKDSSDAPLDSAIARYKQVLLSAPADSDAKWNYELALRRKRGGGGGGGGSNPSSQPSPSASNNQRNVPRPTPGMSPQRAEALLNAAEDQEMDVQGRHQRKNVPTPPPRGKDW